MGAGPDDVIGLGARQARPAGAQASSRSSSASGPAIRSAIRGSSISAKNGAANERSDFSLTYSSAVHSLDACNITYRSQPALAARWSRTSRRHSQ